MRKIVIGLSALCLPCLVSDLLAETTPIAVDHIADWKHTLTGVEFPVNIAGFHRTEINDFGTTQLDIAATYQMDATGSTATLYVFHAGLVDASVWHDRIVSTIAQGRLGKPDLANIQSALFTPPGGNSNSGIRSSLKLEGGNTRASGVAIFPFGEWLVAVRLSSNQLDQSKLDERLNAFVAALKGIQGTGDHAAAYVMQVCADELPSKAAKRSKPDMANALLAGSLGLIIEEKGKTEDSPEPAAAFCRDNASSSDFGVYRSGPASNGYVIAFGDAGVVANVMPDTLAALTSKNKAGGFAISLTTVDQRLNFTPFQSLPNPQQVVAAVSNEAPISSTNRAINGSLDKTLTIKTR